MDGLRAVNVYAIETERGLTLVDGGWAIEEARDAAREVARPIGFGFADITRFLVTHVHRDHYTQAVGDRAASSAPTSASASATGPPSTCCTAPTRSRGPDVAVLRSPAP